MNMQDERIRAACEQLKLVALADQYGPLAQKAAETDQSYADFLEQVLRAEIAARQVNSRSVLLRISALPAIKTLEEFDFEFAAGVPKKQIMELASLAFVERGENVVFLGAVRHRQDPPGHGAGLPGDASGHAHPLYNSR